MEDETKTQRGNICYDVEEIAQVQEAKELC